MIKGIYKFAENFMKVIGLLFAGLLLFSACTLTAYNDDMTSHLFELRFDNVLHNFEGVMAALLLGVVLYRLFCRNQEKALRITLIVVLCWYFFACEYMALFGRSMPNSDSWVVYSMAKSMAIGDLSIINPTESYMSYYPQQIGICAFLSVLIRMIHLFPVSMEEFHILMAMYGVFEVTTVFFMYKTVETVFENSKISFLFLILSALNLPYIMYSSYLYGEVPALMFFSIGAYAFSVLFREKGNYIVNILIGITGMTLAVFVRKNTLVLIIGVVIALVFETFKTKKVRFFLTAILVGLCAVYILPVTVKHYEKESGGTLTTGVTALSYIAMGMQESDNDINPGWYTGFNFDTFEASGCNPEDANILSWVEIEKRLKEFEDNPSYAFSFYKRKFLTQWVDGTYFSRESTHVYYGDRSNFLKELYYGKYSNAYVFVCNIFQILIFAGAFLWAVTAFRKGNTGILWKSFIFIGIFGGFLFHMLWEANSRYILTYACLLIPYAASGFVNTFCGVKALSERAKK